MSNRLFQTIVLSLGFVFFISQNTFAQIEKKWEKPVSSNIYWQQVTYLGNLIVCTRKTLEGVDTENGEIKWELEITSKSGIPQNAYEEIIGSPYIKFEFEDRFILINQFDGKIAFDSNESGIQDISSFYILPKSGTMIVSGNQKNKVPLILSINLMNASENWRMEDQFRFISHVEELNKDELLLISISDVYKFESKSGKEIWKSPIDRATDEQLNKLGGFGSLLKDLAEDVVEKDASNFKLRFFKSPDRDMYIVAAESKLDEYEYETTYRAYRQSDGSELWREKVQVGRKKFKEMARTIELKGLLGNVIFKDNGFLILSRNQPRSNINLYDYETGKGIWGREDRIYGGNSGLEINGYIYEYLETKQEILIATTDQRDRHYLMSIDPQTGAAKYKKPTRVEGSVIGIVQVDNEVLYVTNQSINFINISNGEKKWEKSISTSPKLSDEKEGKIYIYDRGSNILKVLDKQAKAVKDLASSPLSFQGKESPQNLELLEDGVLLYSSQNIAKYSYDGTLLFNKYYPAPKQSAFMQGLTIAAGLYAGLVSAAAYYDAGQLAKAQTQVSPYSQEFGDLLGESSEAYKDYASGAEDVMMACFNSLKTRKKATKTAKDYNFIMTKKEKKITLLKVSKQTGEVDGEIILGQDRDPVYAVDEISGQVFYQDGNKRLVAYKVQ